MELVLLVDGVLEGEDAVGDGVVGSSFQEVVHAGHKQDPHGELGLGVVHLVGVLQVGDGSTRDGDPVNVCAVRGTGDAWFTGLVELVKLTVPKADIQPSVRPDMVAQFTGGTQVHPVAGGVLHALQDPDLPGGVVAVVDRDAR